MLHMVLWATCVAHQNLPGEVHGSSPSGAIRCLELGFWLRFIQKVLVVGG
jgi:hypothetical protein